MTTVRRGVLSDLHRTTNSDERAQFHNEYDFAGHLTRIGRAFAWFEREGVDAMVLCGDLTHTADPDAMSTVLNECCAELDVLVIAVAGNHDVANGEDQLASGIQRLGHDRLVAGDPSGQVVSGMRIAGLQLTPTSGYCRSRLLSPPSVEDWSDEPVVLVSHLPLLSRASTVAAAGLPYPGDVLDREEWAALLLARKAPTIIVSGHIHVRDAHCQGSVLQLLQAAMIESPFEAGVVEISTDDDGGACVRRR